MHPTEASQKLIDLWERLHAWGTRQVPFQRFTESLRVALSAGFFGPGLVKLCGHRFAQDLDGPAGRLFDALFQSGPYWNAIGLAQVVAAIFLVVPALAPIGNLMFLTVIVNIFLITWALQFQGTVVITGLMLLGSVYLLLWDYPRWRLLLPGRPGEQAFRPDLVCIGPGERAGYLLCALSGWMVFTVLRGFLPAGLARVLFFGALPVFLLGGGILLAVWLRAGWRHVRATRQVRQPL